MTERRNGGGKRGASSPQAATSPTQLARRAASRMPCQYGSAAGPTWRRSRRAPLGNNNGLALIELPGTTFSKKDFAHHRSPRGSSICVEPTIAAVSRSGHLLHDRKFACKSRCETHPQGMGWGQSAGTNRPFSCEHCTSNFAVAWVISGRASFSRDCSS